MRDFEQPKKASNWGGAQNSVPAWLPERWQSIVDTIAELANVPAGLVMRMVGDDIEVLVSSRTIGNPYHPGEAMRLPDSGLYCEHVIRSNARLAVPNALDDSDWDHNPDIELGMISYLGVPIRWPDEHPFGTICILDKKERAFEEIYARLLTQFRDIIEHHLSLIYSDAMRELDVAETQKLHAEELRSSDERFRQLVEHAADHFILHDAAGRILDANQHAASHSGMSKEELLGSTVAQLPIQFSEPWDTAVWTAANPGESSTIEASYRLADGGVATTEVRWSCQLLQGEKLFLVLIRDVTERHRAEEAMRLAEAEIARASRLTIMGQLAGSIVHEINQPLAAIATRAEACLRWLDKDEPQLDKARASARLLSDSARDAAGIVAGLRSVAQKSKPTRTEIDVNALVREALLLTRRECEKMGVVRNARFPDTPALVMGDPIQIKQVLLNLILNAAEAMREVEAGNRTIEITTVNEQGHAVVVVEDTGTGLLDATPDQIFEPMFTTKARGMGMGLAICRSIAQAHGGRIWCENRTDRRGARFSLSLPPA